MDDSPDAAADIIVAVTADPETWMPVVFLAIPATVEDIKDGYFRVGMGSEDAYGMGASLIQSATAASAFDVELVDKTVEERREIIGLESQLLLDSPFPL